MGQKKTDFWSNKTNIEIATGGAVVDKIGISVKNYIWKKNKNIRDLFCFGRKINKCLISRMDLPPAGRGIQYFTFLIKNDQIRTKFSKKCQNDSKRMTLQIATARCAESGFRPMRQNPARRNDILKWHLFVQKMIKMHPLHPSK